MSNAPPPHDLTPSLFHSWAPFWELEGGGSPGVGGVGASGLGKAPPGQRPRPLGTFFGAVKTLAMAAPPVALAPRSCKGFGVPVQTQSDHFLSLFWLGGPGLSLGAEEWGPVPPHPAHAVTRLTAGWAGVGAGPGAGWGPTQVLQGVQTPTSSHSEWSSLTQGSRPCLLHPCSVSCPFSPSAPLPPRALPEIPL